MKQPTIDEQTQVEDVPVSPLLMVHSEHRYGRIEGLDEDELADPDELERQVYREAFGPIWMLPTPARKGGIRASIDEDGHVEWGAYGSVDFERMQPEFDKVRYRVEKLREQVKDQVIAMQVLSERVQVAGKFRVLKLVRMGWLDADDIEHGELWLLARLYVRVLGLQAEIARLQEVSRKRKQRQDEAIRARYEAPGSPRKFFPVI